MTGLALHQGIEHLMSEEIVEPDLEIVDAHHHLWGPAADNGTAADASTSVSGETHVGARSAPKWAPYVLEDLLKDTQAGHNVVQSVYVENGWAWDSSVSRPEFAPVGEVREVARIARESQSGTTNIAAIVGHVDLRYGARVGDALDLLQQEAVEFSGIRHATAWDADERVANHRSEPTEALLADETFREGFKELATRDLTFDAWLYHPQLPELCDLADTFPEARIVLNHLGAPLAVGPYENDREGTDVMWRAALSGLCRRPNVYLKLGGIGLPLLVQADLRGRCLNSQELADLWRDRIRWCIEQFGVERCMFESNFPPDRATASYVTIWNSFKRIVADYSSSEKAMLFAGTARNFYRLAPDKHVQGDPGNPPTRVVAR
jgi:L-fuconolactonase